MNYEKEYKKLKADIEKAYLFAQTDSTKAALEHILPELRESEDERIRKEIISFLQLPHPQFVGERKQEKWVAWLEKQGENPICKVKIGERYKCIASPRYTCFFIGDIYEVTDDFIAKLINLCSDCFILLEKQGGKKETLCDKCRKEQSSHSCQDITALGRCAIENQEEPQVYEIEDDKVITYSETDGYKVIEPKFKVGDKIKFAKESKYLAREIINIKNGAYYFDELVYLPFSYQDEWELVEQKSADKVEPKFKVGDWVVYEENIYQIHNLSLKKYYECLRTDGTVHTFDFENIDSKSHFWAIQDAKDGDVLATDSWLYIFKYTNNKAIIQFHCTCPINGKPYKWCFSSDDSYLDIYVDANIHPATKEQRDLLFQKMKEFGYEWDDENKGLKHKNKWKR